jgi:chromosome partitioning protein
VENAKAFATEVVGLLPKRLLRLGTQPARLFTRKAA